MMSENKTGVELIADERKRQVELKEWSSEHDDQHNHGELASAAACYATPPSHRQPMNRRREEASTIDTPVGWPWRDEDWRPRPNKRIRELVKAGALIAAEIDRIQRL